MAATDPAHGADPRAEDPRPGSRAARGRDRRTQLAAYRRRRDFSRTPEPADEPDGPGGESGESGESGGPVYVVQIHDASSMHFDFRLEVGGVLASWAVPKGPSTDPHDKRLAMPTEDHPMDYRDFEGVIEAGEYGGGTVIVWDAGTYRNASTDRSGREVPFAQALAHGHASFRLLGGKLRGRWSLTRFRGGEPGTEDDSGHAKGEAWLLVRSAEQGGSRRGRAAARRDRGSGRRAGSAGSAGSGRGATEGTGAGTGSAGPAGTGRSGGTGGSGGTPDPHRARSARTGRTLAQVAAAGGPTWHSDR